MAVDDDGAGAMDDGIHVLGSVADVVVPYGFPARWKLNLIEPEGADPECLSDTLSCGLAAAHSREQVRELPTAWRRPPAGDGAAAAGLRGTALARSLPARRG